MSDSAVARECARFVAAGRSLALATADADGNPLVSYAPFLRADDGAFYVLLSTLAAHTANLASRPRLSAMIIEDEAGAAEPFARRRAVFDCGVERVARTDTQWNALVSGLRERHGATVDLLRELTDFDLYRLSPLQATFVKGFGQAFELHGEEFELARHIVPRRTRDE